MPVNDAAAARSAVASGAGGGRAWSTPRARRTALAGKALSTGKTLNIGEVLEALREEFPDVSLSKIRYLEAEGLVEPARTSANYRKYAPSDIERLRYVLGAQRDRHLPLKVIKRELEALDRGEGPAPATAPRLVEAEPPTGLDALLGADDRVRVSRRELLGSTGLGEDMLAELEECGLLAAQGGGGWFDGDAMVVARLAVRLSEFGVAPRHLRTARVAADREAGLIAQAAAPLRERGGSAPGARARDAVDELAALMVRLHAALVRSRLRRDAPG